MLSEVDINVLLIEPEEMCRELLARHMHQCMSGATVTATGDLKEAIALLEEENIDLVVCDAYLAGENKMNYVNKLCGLKNISIVIITAENFLLMDSLDATGCRLHVKEVFHKPLDLGEVVCKIQGVIDDIKRQRKQR